MVKKMLINACHPEECRVAVVADGILEELDIQIKAREATLGNIYKGVISRVEPSLQAVFVDYGAPRNGFLSINDVHPSYFPESYETAHRRPRIQDVFRKEDRVVVQVNKEERGNKGASLTTNISLAGRYLVLMPGTDLFGVSRKIEDEKERKKLKELLKQLKLPENIGFIIRTAGMGRTKTELSRDLDYVLKLWQSIEKNVAEQPAPSLLHREHDAVIRTIREHFSPDICEILVDDKDPYQKVRDFFHQVMPKYEPLVKLYQEKRPLFNKYQLEEQVEQVYSKRIKLKSGGHILIEPTEALVTIDVNSGSATKEKGVEETAYRVNMEAAVEVVRQLRLRDLGGIIVIDFIDMTQKKHKQDVEKAVRATLKLDRAKTKVLRISALGLLELSRQRLRSSLGTGEYLECPLCDGAGKVRSPEMSALSTFRKIKSLLIRTDVSEVRATVPAKVAEYLLNTMRGQLVELEKQYSGRIVVQVGHSMFDKEISVEAAKEEPPESPMEAIALAPSPAPPVEPTPVVEEEPAAEAEKKPKKPGRRRRRGKRKPAAGVGEELVAEGTEVEEVEEESLDIERIASFAVVEPGEIELDFVESRIEEELARRVEPMEPEAAEEVVDLPVEEPAKEVEELSLAAPDDVPTEAPEPQQPEPVDLATPAESATEELGEPEAPKETDEVKKEPTKERSAARKSLLQSFLPFS